MAKKRRPTLISAALLFGTIGMIGGTAALAQHPVARMMSAGAGGSDVVAAAPAPSPERELAQTRLSLVTPHRVPTATATAPAKSTAPATPTETSTPKAKPTPRSITYTVVPGDTLVSIAAWFKQHGFEALYAANRAVIGDDPNLIRPGQVIRLSDGVMTVGK